MTELKSHLLVAALDFGTTFSGYAFSFRHEFQTDPLKISTNIWQSVGLSSYKTPTCLLLDKDKQIVAFGFDAETTYANEVLDGNKDDYYYFHRFKMNLHNNKNITKSMLLEDVSGKSLPAADVFMLSIKALKDHLLETLKNSCDMIQEGDIRYVLTVPAIWTDSAKEFMRTAAEEAGIPKDQLVLALEPEAASIYCQYLPTTKLSGSDGFVMSKVGTTYMVVDLGGGTADITVHEKVVDGRLKEKYRATGNTCGGTNVETEFFTLLSTIIGKDVIPVMQRDHPIEYLDLVREFESAKKTIQPDIRTKVILNPQIMVLDSICNEMHGKSFNKTLETSKYKSEINVASGRIRMDLDMGRKLFQPTIDNIISLMEEILSKQDILAVSMILLVGGFSECRFVQEAVRKAFDSKRIVVPVDSGMSVVKGAVLFGHRPDYIQERVMRCTYGIKTYLPFDERKYDLKRLVKIEGKDKVDNIFSVIVRKDEKVEAGSKFKKSYFTPNKNQKTMEFMIYVSNEHNPSFVDDESCSFLCKPMITFSETCDEERWVDVEYIFGNTEIGLVAKDRKSGHTIKANFNLI